MGSVGKGRIPLAWCIASQWMRHLCPGEDGWLVGGRLSCGGLALVARRPCSRLPSFLACRRRLGLIGVDAFRSDGVDCSVPSAAADVRPSGLC